MTNMKGRWECSQVPFWDVSFWFDAERLQLSLPLIPSSFTAVCGTNIIFVLHFVAHEQTHLR